MKLFIACLATESNTFSPIPTARAGFEEAMVAHGNATDLPSNLFTAPLHVWRKRGEELNFEIVESLSAMAQPAGPTINSVYEEYRDEILGDLKQALPVDIVLLSMHGAMIATQNDDCEGDLLEQARAIVGPDTVIGLEIDPHNNFTEKMRTNADLIICYKEYPHTDTADRAEELFDLAHRTVTGSIKPVMRDYDCKMINVYHTPFEPMRSFVDQMQDREGADDILSISLCHGFPWADHPRVGTRTLVITDEKPELAETEAQLWGEKLWELCEKLAVGYPDIPSALDMAIANEGGKPGAQKNGPIVLADTADNAGGGAPSDATFLLSAIIERKLKNTAIGIFWDPMVVRLCMDAGNGANINIRLGGKTGPMSGNPLDLLVKILKISTDHEQHLGEAVAPLGNMVLLECAGIFILVNDNRTQVFHPEVFINMGLALDELDIVCVKSSQHFYAGFEPIASRIIHVATPGAITPDFANIPYENRSPDYWPRVDNPFS